MANNIRRNHIAWHFKVELCPPICPHRPIPSDLRSAEDVVKETFESGSSSLKNPPRPPVPFVVGGGALFMESNGRCFGGGCRALLRQTNEELSKSE